MTLSLRKNISHKSVLYKSLGVLIKDYRQWREFSQETLAESIGISVRELQNWEADRRRARIENLHDLAEVTGIPMQVCVALNADQPIWYSLQKRRFAYSSIEAQYFHKEFFRYSEISGNRTFAKTERISTDKHITKILTCHREIYCTEKPLSREVIEAAITILPDLNQIIFDSSGHYVGHNICLPLRRDVYQQLKQQKDFEHYLTPERVSDIIALKEGVFFYYSAFAGSLNVAHQMVIEAARFLVKLEQKERYILAQYAAIAEVTELLNNFGMVVAENWPNRDTESFPKLYEIALDALMGPLGPWDWLINEYHRSAGAEKAPLKAERRRRSSNVPKEPNKLSPSPKRYPITKLPNTAALTVDGNYDVLTVDQPLQLPSTGNARACRKKAHISNYTGACPNPKCPQYGKPGEGRIVANGTYRSKDGASSHRFLCKKCGKSFCSKTETIFYGLRSPEGRVLEAFKLLAKGLPLRRIAVVLGVEFRTVRHWLELAAAQSGNIDATLRKALGVSQSELDALWAFAKKDSLRQRAILWREAAFRTQLDHKKDPHDS